MLCRAKKGAANKLQAPPVTFRDVAGLDTAKEELLEVVACLRDARRYARLNAKTPSGVLLTGPPGTGKTLLGEFPSPLWYLLCLVAIPLRSCTGRPVTFIYSVLPLTVVCFSHPVACRAVCFAFRH